MWKGDVKKMMHKEKVRSLNCNYERILLDKKPTFLLISKRKCSILIIVKRGN